MGWAVREEVEGKDREGTREAGDSTPRPQSYAPDTLQCIH